MKAYLATTSVAFGLLTVVHIWRVVEEGTQLARQPFFVLVTVISAALCVWAARLFRRSTR